MFIADQYFSNFFKPDIEVEIENYLTVPSQCSLVAMRYCSHDMQNLLQIIQDLSHKAQQVIIFIQEPDHDFYQIFDKKLAQYPNVKVFAEVVPNYASNIHTLISWFTHHENIYQPDKFGYSYFKMLDFNFNKPKMFDCLLGKAREHRQFISRQYFKSKFKDKIIFSYVKDNLSTGIWDFEVRDLTNTVQWVEDKDDNATLLCNYLPIHIYNQTYYSIVAETFTKNSFSFFTEKTAKPLVAKRPFVVFAGQYHLKNLRHLGFQTFNNIIDESYDNDPDDCSRWKMAWDQVEYLCSLDPQKVITECTNILEHNHNHLIETDWFAEFKSIRDSKLDQDID